MPLNFAVVGAHRGHRIGEPHKENRSALSSVSAGLPGHADAVIYEASSASVGIPPT
jgi:hypothetical protein